MAAVHVLHSLPPFSSARNRSRDAADRLDAPKCDVPCVCRVSTWRRSTSDAQTFHTRAGGITPAYDTITPGSALDREDENGSSSQAWLRLLSGHGIVAIVDDDEAVRIGLQSLMRSIDVKAEIFASAESFFESDQSRFACVLSDIQMPGRSGLDLLVAVRASNPDLPVVLMTAFPDDRVRERAKAAGAHSFFVKPCNPNELVDVVESLLALPR